MMQPGAEKPVARLWHSIQETTTAVIISSAEKPLLKLH
jgi:hypothetical protein